MGGDPQNCQRTLDKESQRFQNQRTEGHNVKEDFASEVVAPGNLDFDVTSPFLEARCSVSELPEEYRLDLLRDDFVKMIRILCFPLHSGLSLMRQPPELNFTHFLREG